MCNEFSFFFGQYFLRLWDTPFSGACVCVCLCVSPHPTEVLTYKLQCCCGNSQNRIVLPLFFWQPVRTVSIYVMRTIHYGIAAIAHHLVFTQHSNDRLSRIVACFAPPEMSADKTAPWWLSRRLLTELVAQYVFVLALCENTHKCANVHGIFPSSTVACLRLLHIFSCITIVGLCLKYGSQMVAMFGSVCMRNVRCKFSTRLPSD